MKLLPAFLFSMFVFISSASAEAIRLNSVLVERDVDGNPYVTIQAENSACEYPHYCNNKGVLYALKSHNEKIEKLILEAMDSPKKKSLAGTKGGWVGQDDGWQIFDLWVDDIR